MFDSYIFISPSDPSFNVSALYYELFRDVYYSIEDSIIEIIDNKYNRDNDSHRISKHYRPF